MDKHLKSGGNSASVTTSTALLNQKLANALFLVWLTS